MKFYESIAVALITALATGLFMLAYRHPRAYGKLANIVYALVFGALLIWVGYIFGYGDGAEAVVSLAASGGEISDFDTSPFGVTVTLILGGVIATITALRFVHRLKDD